MTPTDDQACWGCGKKTESKCLPCSERGFDIFFCSKEHQKLVWKQHKRICGERSNPFRFPPFDATELDLLRQAKSMNLSDEDLAKSGNVSGLLRSFINASSSDFSSIKPEFAHMAEPYGMKGMEDEIPSLPFFFVSRLEADICAEYPTLQGKNGSRRISSSARHSALILYTLADRHLQAGHN
ncbi:hypothetical protein JCM8547_000519 [Rhodosporidiobolus lusitaniae]